MRATLVLNGLSKISNIMSQYLRQNLVMMPYEGLVSLALQCLKNHFSSVQLSLKDKKIVWDLVSCDLRMTKLILTDGFSV